MKIGIISDIHDNILNLNIALDYFKKSQIQELIFCGDFCSPIPIHNLGNFTGKVHCVFGNGDGDRFTIQNIIQSKYKNITIYGEYANIEINSKKIAITHYPFYGKYIAKGGDFDAVFVGHSHKPSVELIQNCLLINPGDIMGLYNKPSFAVYNYNNNKAQIIYLEQLKKF